jgi:DNA-directed RNA polymerase subunit M/transcription elongation factor TFIIS
MAKKFDSEDRVQQLEKENRELKLLNRSLLKRLKKLDRNASRVEELEEEIKEQEERAAAKKEEARTACPKCNKNELTTTTIAGRSFVRCELCGYRSKAQKTR